MMDKDTFLKKYGEKPLYLAGYEAGVFVLFNPELDLEPLVQFVPANYDKTTFSNGVTINQLSQVGKVNVSIQKGRKSQLFSI